MRQLIPKGFRGSKKAAALGRSKRIGD